MKLVVKITLFLLRHTNLSVEDRNALAGYALEKLSGLPIYDIIFTNEDGDLIVNGRLLDIEQMTQLRESARLALDNKALNLIRQQVMYKSFILGSVKAKDVNDLIFARAAVWWGQEVENYLKTLAQRDQQPTLSED